MAPTNVDLNGKMHAKAQALFNQRPSDQYHQHRNAVGRMAKILAPFYPENKNAKFPDQPDDALSAAVIAALEIAVARRAQASKGPTP